MIKFNDKELTTLQFNGVDITKVVVKRQNVPTIVFPSTAVNSFPTDNIQLIDFNYYTMLTTISTNGFPVKTSTQLKSNKTYNIYCAGISTSANPAVGQSAIGGVSYVQVKFSENKTIYLSTCPGGAGTSTNLQRGGDGKAISLASGTIDVGDIAREPENLLIVAGGGGSTSGGTPIYNGGFGGGLNGGLPEKGSNATYPGVGTQTNAGAGGTGTGNRGGNAVGYRGGAYGQNQQLGSGHGGGGGGGYYGGGGGASGRTLNNGRSGGAGGSGYASTSELISGVIFAETCKYGDANYSKYANALKISKFKSDAPTYSRFHAIAVDTDALEPYDFESFTFDAVPICYINDRLFITFVIKSIASPNYLQSYTFTFEFGDTTINISTKSFSRIMAMSVPSSMIVNNKATLTFTYRCLDTVETKTYEITCPASNADITGGYIYEN